MDARAPDAIEPVVGWRAWIAQPSHADRPCDSWALHSVAYAMGWLAGEPLRAQCRLPRGACRDIPGPRCHCGIYAVHDAVAAYNYIRNPRRVISGTFSGVPIVLGEVALWGRVVVGQLGWRGEFGYPRRLFVLAGSGPDDVAVAKQLGDYRVPVSVMSRKALFDMFPSAQPAPGPLRSLLQRFASRSSMKA